MNSVYEKVELCYKQIRTKIDFVPKVAIVLGSGLGALAEVIKVVDSIDYAQIQGFPVSTVDGHKGRFVFGYIEETPVVIMQGRVHFYEGYAISDVVLPIRVMKKLGAEILFLTNSAGGLNTMYRPGDFMMITDQIASFMPSPLQGANVDEWGSRFPSMENLYDTQLCECIRQSARDCNVPLREGVYVQMRGPQYESTAEVRMSGNRWRCRWYEYGDRSNCRTPHGNACVRIVLYLQYGLRNQQDSIEPYGSDRSWRKDGSIVPPARI